jgi:hypothetical protein
MHSRWILAFLWLWGVWSVVSTLEYASGGTPSLAGLALGICVAGALLYGRASGVQIRLTPAKPTLDLPPRR